MTRYEDEETRVTREVAARAIRRLDVLEWILYVGTAGLAVLGGALIAWLLSASASLDFRPTWVVASIVLFVVPGGIALARARRDERLRTALREAARREKERSDQEHPPHPPEGRERDA